MRVLGIDIGGTSVKAVLREGGTIGEIAKSATFDRPSGEELRRAVASVVPDGEFDAIGLCVPGVLSADRSHVEAAANLPGLVGLPLATLIPRHRGSLVVTTDQIAAATDFAARRELRGRLLAVSLGTGVGAAVLDVDDDYPLGRPLRVNGDSPGHLGQIDVSLDDHPPVGPDGGAGGVEAYLGKAALAGRDPSTLDENDPAIRALVRLLRVSHALYRPNHIALLGGVGLRLTHLRDAIIERTNHRLTSLAREGWTLDFADDDHHAADGAARLAANER